MSDLISRQAAIDAVEFGITYAKAINKSTGEVKELFKEGNKALNEAVERIKDLPSAQSEPSQVARDIATILENEKDMRVIKKNAESESCADTISRKAAIDAISSMFAPTPTQKDMVEDCLEIIENLPSVHPKQKKGRWIPVTRIEKWHKEEGLVGFPPEVKEFPQCTIEWVDATEPDEVDGLRCSKCGTVYDFTEARNWCSECGAKMEGQDEAD